MPCPTGHPGSQGATLDSLGVREDFAPGWDWRCWGGKANSEMSTAFDMGR